MGTILLIAKHLKRYQLILFNLTSTIKYAL